MSFFVSKKYSAASTWLSIGIIFFFTPMVAFSETFDYGATASPKGTSFKVWAPNAQAVCVIGNFNNWTIWSNTLSPDSDGSWSGFISEALVGDVYKYVIANNGSLHYRKDPYSRGVTNSIGNSVIVDPNSYVWQSDDWTRPSWNEMVIYEMHIGTYASQDVGGQVATLDDAIDRLDHLKDIGINCVELMPVSEFPGERSWGYNPSQPFSIESSYGGPQALKRFIDSAHQRGIAVLLDVVWNHLGPTDLDLWQFDGSEQDNIYFYNDYRANTPWGNTRPDFSRGEVRQYIRDNFIYLLDEYRVDGFRVDGTKFIRRTDIYGEELPEGWSLLQWINNEIDLYDSGAISIAEDLDSSAWITKTTGAGGAGFDSQWDWFVHIVRSQLAPIEDSSRSMVVISQAILNNYNNEWLDRVIYTESHDEVANGKTRVPEEIDPDNPDSFYAKKRSLLGACLVFTSPGIPMIFQGQEMLEDGWFTDEDPLDWNKASVYRGIVNCYKDLIFLRRNLLNVTQGLSEKNVNIFHLNEDDKLMGYHRFGDGGIGDDVVVVMNFSSEYYSGYRVGLPRAGEWFPVLNSDSRRYDPDFSNYGAEYLFAENIIYDGLAQSAEISIAPYSFVIYSQKALDESLDPIGACCNNEYCYLIAESVCYNYGGVFGGADSSCDDVSCELPPQPGACCSVGNCFQVLEAQCSSIGGSFEGEGVDCSTGCVSCASDLTGDQVVNVLDLLIVVSNFGSYSDEYDITGDGYINTLDFLTMIASFGACE